MTQHTLESMLGLSPFCVAFLSVHSLEDGGRNYQVEYVNATFETVITPKFKMEEALKETSFFQYLTTSDEHRQDLLRAVEAVFLKKEDRAKARNIEVLTLTEQNGGFPIKRHFDWIVTRSAEQDGLVLYGDPCNDQDVEQRAKDAELVDFFHNAPIALHWLSGEGIVLWANKRELEVLGYTEEEYIGQPIMKFCPDEKELVLEIFKQLGSGNTIKDVPVRFRTKQGKLVHLLIDSNVKYDEYGKFAHTRCFIRDDTGRKIHEAKAKLLLEETKRSLKMLDNFMSRSLHHVRTPLHILQGSVDLIKDNVKAMQRLAIEENVSKGFRNEIDDCVSLLEGAGEHIHNGVEMINDISDLAKLDQQQELKLLPELVDLSRVAQDVFGLIDIPDDVEAALEFQGGGSTHLNVDRRYLSKVLRHLIDHCANGKDPEHTFAGQDYRHVSLIIGHADGGKICTFQVVVAVGEHLTSHAIMDLVNEKVQAAGQASQDRKPAGTDLPPMFQKYHQELLPDEILDVDVAGSLRKKIEAGINSQRFDSLHIGLALSYHLVNALGGDLRYSSRPTHKCFSFGIPHSSSELKVERIVFKSKKKVSTTQQPRFVPPPETVANECTNQAIVDRGTKAMDPPTVLVVEDIPMCAKLLVKQLNGLNCSTKWAENGQIAVDLIRENPFVYDLILMDIRMPIMDGIEATRIIKQELHCTTPVVALTGEAGDDIREQCAKLGFDGFRNKPMKREFLLSVLHEHAGYTVPGFEPPPKAVTQGPSQ